MPTGSRYLLACYFDVSDISFALISIDSNNVEFFNFPYTYSDEAFSNRTNEGAFNKTVIDTFLKNKKIKTEDLEIITIGFMDVPLVDVETKLSQKLISLIKEVGGIYPFVVNDFSVLTKDALLSYESRVGKNLDMDESENNELANLSIYPQLIPTDIPTITTLDKSLTEKINLSNLEYDKQVKLSFSGSRFSRPSVYEYLDWILAIDLVRKPGIYEIYLDRKNTIPLFKLVSKYKPEMSLDVAPHLEQIGTLINAPGETECLLNSDVGTGQFFEIKKDSFYVVPMLAETGSSLSIKNHTLGNFKKAVTGGRAGLMVNTLNGSIFNNVKVFNDCVKQLSLCTPRS